MYKLCVYIPESALEKVKSAMFEAGAGRIGQYDYCCWQVPGSGQFRPLEGSDPTLGIVGELETVAEFKIELVVENTLLEQVLVAMKAAHPYEEPAYQFWEVNLPVQ